jgi:hypothetical protein
MMLFKRALAIRARRQFREWICFIVAASQLAAAMSAMALNRW